MALNELLNLIIAVAAVLALFVSAVALFLQVRTLVKKDVEVHEKRHKIAEDRLNTVEGAVATLKSTIEAKIDALLEDVKFIKSKVF